MEYIYQVEALKDDYEELEENYRVLQKEFKGKSREHETLKRDHKELANELNLIKSQFEQKLKCHDEEQTKTNATIQQLEEELERHKSLLEESEKARQQATGTASKPAVPVADDITLTRETNKQIREYHYKWKMAEQENAILQTSVSRLENQVSRYKESLKEAEDTETELKAEKRKLLRELRESQAKAEELETNNTHLQKRLDRLRSRNLTVNTPAGADSTSLPPSSVIINTSTSTTTSIN